MRRALVLLGLCGCDALFGLDALDDPSDAAIDTPSPRRTVRGNITRHWVSQSVDNLPLREQVPFPSASPFTVRLADGTVAVHTWDPIAGEFTFEADEGERHAVSILHSTGTFEYQLATPSIVLDDIWLGHPTQIPPTSTATVDWVTAVTSTVATEIKIATTGVWSTTTPTATATPGRYSVAWPSATFFGGQKPAVLDAAKFDSLHVMHYTTNTATSPATRTFDQYLSFGNVSTSSTGTTTVTGNLQAIARPNCADVHWTHTADLARLTQRHPQFSSPQGDTRLMAASIPDQIGFRTSYELQLVFGGNTNSSFMFQYANPFELDVVLLDNIFLTRTGPNIGTISVNVQYFSIISQTTSCTRHDIATGAPLPYGPTLNGVPLVDNVVVGSDGVEPLELKWSIDPAGTYPTQVNLFEGSVLVRSYYSVDNRVLIPPADIKANTAYRVSFTSSTHYPNAAMGDFRTRAFPFSLGVMSTGFFSISKPS